MSAHPTRYDVLVVALIALVAWFALGSFYTVQPNEVGINLVFGRYTGKTANGLNTNWPWPIGEVIKVPVSDQQITEVGYRSDAGGADTVLTLYQANAATVIASSDDTDLAGGDLGSRVVAELPAGTYYAKVAGAGRDGGYYNLLVDPTLPNGTIGVGVY